MEVQQCNHEGWVVGTVQAQPGAQDTLCNRQCSQTRCNSRRRCCAILTATPRDCRPSCNMNAAVRWGALADTEGSQLQQTSRSRPSTLPHFSCSRPMGPGHPLHILNGHPSPLASPACSSVHPPLTSTLPRRLGGALAPACCCGQPPGCSARPRPGRHVSGRCADGGLKQSPR